MMQTVQSLPIDYVSESQYVRPNAFNLTSNANENIFRHSGSDSRQRAAIHVLENKTDIVIVVKVSIRADNVRVRMLGEMFSVDSYIPPSERTYLNRKLDYGLLTRDRIRVGR